MSRDVSKLDSDHVHRNIMLTSAPASKSSTSLPRRLFFFLVIPATVAFGLHRLSTALSADPMSLASLRASAGTFPTRRALVIGGTSGIGHGVAVRLARAEFDVTIAGRNAEAANSVLEEMKAAGSGKHAFRKIDASLMSGVKSFAEEFRKEQDRLDVLVLTQGMFTLQGRTETKEGTDVKLALHYCWLTYT